MSIPVYRTVSAILSRDNWQAVAPVIKREARRKKPRWTLFDVADYGGGYVHLSIALHGSFWADLDAIFAAHVPDWEKWEEV